MDLLTKALANANEESLTALANKGLYKRAVKDTDSAALSCRRTENSAEVDIGGETVTLCVPLENSKCSCVSRTVCRHILGAILLMKNSLSDEECADAAADIPAAPETADTAPADTAPPAEEPPAAAPTLTSREVSAVNACASDCLRLLEDILCRGLVRIPDSAPDDLEAAAVRCHSLKMADAERLLRDLGGRLNACLQRRASFSISYTARKFCRTASLLRQLSDEDISPGDLGVFRQSYDDVSGDLTILPVGMRDVHGGEYEGSVYYFLDVSPDTEHRFLTFSDLRPVFYDVKRRRGSGSLPWGLTAPLKNMMRSKMVLRGAKLSGCKLSSSQDTHVVMHSPAVLDCDEVHSLIVTDFRQIAESLSADAEESERLFFVHPQKCSESRFDKFSQQYIMTLEDCNGNSVRVTARYSAKDKNFIELLESIGRKMTAEPQKNYTLLVSASISSGELTLFPIEIYDFLRIPYVGGYVSSTDCSGGMYAATLIGLLDEVRDIIDLTLQCGLRSGTADCKTVENKCFNYGLKGLSRLTADFISSASAYRHSMSSGCRDALFAMAALDNYINTASVRLDRISAVFNMKGMK